MGKEGENGGEIGKNFAQQAQHAPITKVSSFITRLRFTCKQIKECPINHAPY